MCPTFSFSILKQAKKVYLVVLCSIDTKDSKGHAIIFFVRYITVFWQTIYTSLNLFNMFRNVYSHMARSIVMDSVYNNTLVH